jgi:hypothetical protein
MTRRLSPAAAAALVAIVSLAACKKEPPPPPKIAFRVQSVDVGKAIGADKKLKTPLATFGRRDTIYAVVASVGVTPRVTMLAKWIDAKGKELATYSQTVATTGPASTEFNVHNTKGWTPGKYKVELLANGTPVGTKTYDVK